MIAPEPLQRLAADRAAAREQGDGWAALCTLATVTSAGDAEQRTLVLRDMDERLALFFSATAPKWQQLQTRPTCSVAIYLPTTQVQYRLRAKWERIDPALVRSSWLLRPDMPKKLDWLYQIHPQSSPIVRTDLVAQLATELPTPEAAPGTAMGVYLNPLKVERLELSAGVHQRECWELGEAGDWAREDLVP